MPELGFRKRSLPSTRSSFRAARDASPDSVIFTLESNINLFSSASASADRCSFASDAHEHDSLSSEISLHLTGHDGESIDISGGPDPDSNKPTLYSLKHRKGDKAKVQKEDISDDDIALDSARSSFSLALKECQNRRSRSEALKKLERRRPASLDLNNAAVSPRLASIKKSSLTSRNTGIFPSPGTPNYRLTGVGMQKGWSSERVPLHTNAGRKNLGASLLPVNSGRTLPSKWEDAERWICSPVSGDSMMRHSIQHPHRKPKSKSGPLGPPGVAYYSLYSPVMPMFEGGKYGNFMAASPFSASVIAADRLDIRRGGHAGAFPVQAEPSMARSASVHGCTEILNQESLPAPEDEKHEDLKDAATSVSDSVSRRDMATLMSPDDNSHSSPKTGPSFANLTPSILPIVELQGGPSSKLEVRDVQVDERVTVTRWSKKHRALISGKRSETVDIWKKKDADVQSPAWDLSDTTKNIAEVTREEARITAWENLQKAKAEAAIRKLEMKLEKKRSSSMDKIMNKLRSAQKRAQSMRNSMLANQGHQVARTSQKAVSFRRTRQMGSLSICFTCHAF